jgi:hypothetical protein
MPRTALRTLLALLLTHAAIAQDANQIRSVTRFGNLGLDEENYVIFKGRRVEPPMQANSALEMGEPVRLGSSYVVLVTIIGGTACPYLYHFVTVSKAGAKATGEFGTCNQATDVKRSASSIVVSMRGFRGPFEPEASRKKAFREHHTFIFRDGVVTENGKPAK